MNIFLDTPANVMAVTDRGKTFKTTPTTFKKDLPHDLAVKVASAFRKHPKGWIIVGKPDALSTH
jgi:hypothetical protein